MNNKSKILGFLVVIMSGILILAIFHGFIHWTQKPYIKETKYSGIVTGKLYEPPSSGYKSKKDAEYWVLFKENRKGLIIRIRVSVPTYYDLNVGDKCTFILKNITMYHYGNTTSPRKNLYNE